MRPHTLCANKTLHPHSVCANKPLRPHTLCANKAYQFWKLNLYAIPVSWQLAIWFFQFQSITRSSGQQLIHMKENVMRFIYINHCCNLFLSPNWWPYLYISFNGCFWTLKKENEPIKSFQYPFQSRKRLLHSFSGEMQFLQLAFNWLLQPQSTIHSAKIRYSFFLFHAET